MATNIDAMPFLRGGNARTVQAGEGQNEFSCAWRECLAHRPGIASRFRAALFGAYLRCFGITQEEARERFKDATGWCARAWRHVDDYSGQLRDLATRLIDRAPRVPTFKLLMAVKAEVSRWFPDRSAARLVREAQLLESKAKSARHPAFGRLVPRLWMQAEQILKPAPWAQPGLIDKALDVTYRRTLEASYQAFCDAGGMDRFAPQALAQVLREMLHSRCKEQLAQADASIGRPDFEGSAHAACTDHHTVSPARGEALATIDPVPARGERPAEKSQDFPQADSMEEVAVQAPEDADHEWRKRFAQACAGAAWDDSEVRALMGLHPDKELLSAPAQVELRNEITALAQKAGPRAGVPLERDPDRLAIQIVAEQVRIHRAFRMISQKAELANPKIKSPAGARRVGGVDGLLGALGGSDALAWPHPGAPDGSRIAGHRKIFIAAAQEQPS